MTEKPDCKIKVIDRLTKEEYITQYDKCCTSAYSLVIEFETRDGNRVEICGNWKIVYLRKEVM